MVPENTSIKTECPVKHATQAAKWTCNGRKTGEAKGIGATPPFRVSCYVTYHLWTFSDFSNLGFYSHVLLLMCSLKPCFTES